MKKAILSLLLTICSTALFAQTDTAKQFMLIVRYNPKMQLPSKAVLAENIKHWDSFMGELGRAGQIVTGYRPSPEGETITGKGVQQGAYYSNHESVSSLIIIKAASIAAQAIAKKCPILELKGSVEVRPLLMMN